MAKSPNTTPSNDDNNNWSLKASYEYKYPGWVQSNPFISAVFDAVEQEEQQKQKEQEIETANELARLDYIESEFIQDMLTYPDAEAIIKRIMKQGEGND
jgi:hypothetical protein